MGKPLRALVVEDSEEDYLLLLRELRRAGFEPEARRVDDPEDLRAALGSASWDIVISDHSMPGFDGLAALRLVRERDLDLPFIIVSGTIGEEVAVAAMRAGAGDYVMKDGLARLSPAVEREIREAAGHRARSQAEEALQQSEAILRATLESINDGVLVVGEDRAVVQHNTRFRDIWSIPDDVMASGKDDVLVDYVLPQVVEPDRFIARLEDVYQKSRASEDSVRLKDGRTLERHSYPLIQEGAQRGTVWLFRDITEREQAEERLRSSRAHVQALLSDASIVLWAVDPDGVFTLSEGLGLASLGLSPGEVVGQSVFDVYGDNPDFVRDIRRALGGETLTVVQQVGTMTLETRMTPAPGRAGGRSGIIGVSFDITERTRWEEERANLQSQLQQAQKMESVGRLAGGIAHDFNNNLHVIGGFAGLLQRKLPADEKLSGYAAEIAEAARRAQDVTRQLLTFSRRQLISPVPSRLDGLIERLRGALARLIGDDIQLRVCADTDLWVVKVDPAQIDQILLNLAVNARDAMPTGGKLTIETANVRFDEAYCRHHIGATPGDYVLLAVSDDGIGMDEETLSRIFEPFFTTKEEGKGTGLGLATVYGITEQNGGFMSVHSEPGEGTTFKIYLPRTLDADAAETESPDRVEHVGSGTILIVEDNESVRRLTAALVESIGYTAEVAGSPAEAIELLEQDESAIDLVLTDVVMPGMNGRELSDRLRELRPGIKVVFTSGYAANVVVHHGVLEKGVQFIAKPFGVTDLSRKLGEVLAAK